MEACEAMEQGIRKLDKTIDVIKCPMADGGEGTLDVLEQHLVLERVYCQVSNPLMRSIEAYYLSDNEVAYIEMAQASGLQCLQPSEYDPLKTSSYGTGELIEHAIESGVGEIYLLIGGSATNDGGIGMAAALGFDFLDKNGQRVTPNGQGLSLIERVVPPQYPDLLKGIHFTVLTDVQNLLCGRQGAAHVYAKQKGADEAMINQLDDGLVHLSRLLKNGFEQLSGAGAAGGLGYGAMTFLAAELRSGVDFIMETIDFENKLKSVDLVITGEGKLDLQTLEGKVVFAVCQRAKYIDIKVAVICGDVESPEYIKQALGAFGVYSLLTPEVSTKFAMTNASELIERNVTVLLKEFISED